MGDDAEKSPFARNRPIEPVEPATVPRPRQTVLLAAFRSPREPGQDSTGNKIGPQSPVDCGRPNVGVRPPGLGIPRGFGCFGA